MNNKLLFLATIALFISPQLMAENESFGIKNSNSKYNEICKDCIGIFSRMPTEVQYGAVIENNEIIANTDGEYGTEGFIFQELCILPKFDDNYV